MCRSPAAHGTRPWSASCAPSWILVHGVDPFVTALVHGDIAYFRLHGIGGYRYRFTDDDLHRLVGWCRDARGANWKAVYVLFNNIAMLADARRFLALTAQSSW